MSEGSKDWHVVPFDESRIKTLQSLHKEVNAKFYTLDELSKKYQRSIAFMAVNDAEQVVAFQGLTLYNFDSPQGSIVGGQSGDSMTLDAYRGKGIFTTLAKACHNKAAEDGLAFVFGFPNQASYPIFKNKLDWQFVEHNAFFQSCV